MQFNLYDNKIYFLVPKSPVQKVTLAQKRRNWAAASLSGKGAEIDDATRKEENPTNEGHNFTKASPKPRRSNVAKPKVVITKDAKAENKRVDRPKLTKRPQSAPPKKRVEPKRVSEEPKVELGEFSKSLKLLGMDIPSNRTEATEVKNQEIVVKTKEPTFRTRILKRSGSFADLTKNLTKDMKKAEFEAVKNDLSRAVFEEWYFKKCEEERDKKNKKKLEAEIKAKEEEEKKKEMELLSKEEFDKWITAKKMQARKEKKKKEVLERGKIAGERVVDPEEIEKKNKEWKESKKKDLIKQKEKEEELRKREEKERIEKDTKRTEAEKTFLKWKEDKEKESKEKLAKEKEKQKKKTEEEIEKRKEADLAFASWKNQKAKLLKEKEIKRILEIEQKNQKPVVLQNATDVPQADDETDKKIVADTSVSKPAITKEKLSEENKDEKLEEAKLAYEAWLDYIEARDEERLMFDEERKKILMWKPPWCPGGKAMF